MGLTTPISAPEVVTYDAIGSAAQPVGVNFNGGVMTTTNSSAGYKSVSIEMWVKFNPPSIINPLISFESAQSGASAQVYQVLYTDALNNVVYGVYDTVSNSIVTTNSNFPITDNQWHQITVSYVYVPSVGQAISYNNGLPTANLSASSQSSQLTTGVSSNSNQAIATAAAPANFQLFIWVDGILIVSGFPNVTPSSTNGYWRVGATTGYGTSFSTIISQVSIRKAVSVGMDERWNTMVWSGGLPGGTGGLQAYQTAVVSSLNDLQFWWKMDNTAGTTITESVAGNTGNLSGTYTLNQHPVLNYKAWTATTSFNANDNIIDPNGNIQNATNSGTSGGAAPTWNTSAGGKTTDGGITWLNLGPGALITTKSHQWLYSFVDKFGNFSTASPLSQIVGPSTKPQFVQLTLAPATTLGTAYAAVFRTTDGGSTLFYVDSIQAQVNVPGGAYIFNDSRIDGDLNILMTAPISHANDQPPQGLRAFAYHLGRLWGAVGNVLYASGGPDTIVGNGNESWPPANSWNYPSPIVKLIPHSTGLIVLTNSGIWTHAGGPAIPQFYPQPLYEKIGILSWNAADIKGNEIAIFSTDKVAALFDLSTNALSDVGYPIADLLNTFDPSKVYVVYHRKGTDTGLYYSDGSTGWYRCVSQQPPDFSITGPVWSPKADIMI
jgi:hypothetical protein